MAKSAIAMDAGEITALENEELAPPEAPVEKEPVVEVADNKGGKSEAEPEFVAEPEEGEKPQSDAKKPKPAGEKPRTTVPHEALHAEREEHKKTRAQLQAQEVRQARLEERLSALNEAWTRGQQQQQTAPEPEAIPDVNQDPLAAIAWTQQRQIRAEREKANAEREWSEHYQRQKAETEEQQAAEQERATAYRDVTAYWERAAAENPQIVDAYNALRQSYASELTALGWRGREDIAAQLNNIEWGHILNCWRTGTPIDQFVTQLAATRAGWKPKEPEPEAEPEVKNGKANADTLKRLAKAQDASDTLSGMGGGSGGNQFDLLALDRLTDKEVQALVVKLERSGEGGVDRAMAKMMGIPPGRA